MTDEFEKQLSNIKLKPASDDYQSKAQEILKELSHEASKKHRKFNWHYLWAFSLALSVTFNWVQYTQPNITVSSETLLADNTAQKSQSGYSVIQGAMVPYGSQRDLIILLEN